MHFACRLVEVEEAVVTLTVDQVMTATVVTVDQAVTATVVTVVLALRKKHAMMYVGWKLVIPVQSGCIDGSAHTTMEQ